MNTHYVVRGPLSPHSLVPLPFVDWGMVPRTCAWSLLFRLAQKAKSTSLSASPLLSCHHTGRKIDDTQRQNKDFHGLDECHTTDRSDSSGDQPAILEPKEGWRAGLDCSFSFLFWFLVYGLFTTLWSVIAAVFLSGYHAANKVAIWFLQTVLPTEFFFFFFFLIACCRSA